MSLRIEWLGEPERFAQLGPHWDEMLPPDARPFDCHAWYAAWYRAFHDDSRMRVCLAWEGDRLRAAFPLVERQGHSLSAMANVHTPVFRPVGGDGAAVQAVVDAALASGTGNVELIAISAGDPSLTFMQDAASEAGRRHVIARQHVSPIVDLVGTYEDWRASSRPRWSAPLERFRRKMARDHEAEFSIVEPPESLEAELARGFAVEASGWKGQGGTAIVSDPGTMTFYSELAHSFADRGELRLSRIVLDGEWAAFDLCLLHRRRLYLLKTGYDERFRRLAPGLVMRLSIIERCFELGIHAHELLGDDAEWKRKFSTGERAHLSFHAYERGIRGRVGYTYRAAARPLLKRAYDGTLAKVRP
ncbi:MAG TPA: GNAT family N-acetyltransferase [Thermoleophilaceae bacterium]|nr:GNAT family N-acetyltransferase [Thermoleophilaceae bacterium]